MAEAAVKYSQSPIRVTAPLAIHKRSFVPTQEVVLLGVLLAILQLWDGVLTGIGMLHWGTGMEGNLFLRFLMEQFGYITALVLIKCAALPYRKSEEKKSAAFA